MKKALVAMMMAAVTGTTLQARGAAPDGTRKITVCMEGPMGTSVSIAKMTVTEMFAGIGVAVAWRNDFRECPAGGLKISVSEKTPETLQPGALAYALPYEGTHIVVFHDRIVRMRGVRSIPRLMAHVMAHEITHILEGIGRHSDSGVMKAHWTNEDFIDMARTPLEFAKDDMDLIYAGLARRAGRTAGAAVSATAAKQ